MDVGEGIGAIRCLVLEDEVARLVEHDVHDHPLAGSEDHGVDELLVLDAATVAANQLHPRARENDVEDPRVGGIREVEAEDFVLLRLQRRESVSPAMSKEVAEAAHGHVGHLRRPKAAMLPSSRRTSSSVS